MGAQQRIVGVGHIPGREYGGVGGGQVLIDDDAVVDRQARRGGQLGVGRDAHADHDRVGRHDVAVGQAHAGRLVGRTDDFGHAGVQPQLDIVGAVQRGVGFGHLRAEDAPARAALPAQ